MMLFSGTSNQALAQQVSQLANIPLGKLDIVRFGDSEIKPRILENVRDQSVLVFQSTSNPVNEHLMELMLMVDALRRSAAKRIIAVIPYYGYARQNQQHLPGEPVSAHVVATMLQSAGVNELITIDLHEEQITGFFDMPVSHLSALPMLAEAIKKDLESQDAINRITTSVTENQDAINRVTTSVTVASPDQGGVERTRKFADVFGLTETVLIEKKRDLEHTHESKVVEITGDVTGKTVIIPDDVIVSGGTILHAADAVLAHGAKRVILAATHADFIAGAAEKLQNAPVEMVYVTDTIQLPKEQVFPKLKVISVAALLAKKLKELI